MKNRTMTIEVAGNPHNPGDVLHINDERWIVVQTTFDLTYSKVVLEPLTVFVAKTTYCSQIPENSLTIAEYLEKLCDEYADNCAC